MEESSSALVTSWHTDKKGDPHHALHKGKATSTGKTLNLECSCGYRAHGTLTVYGDNKVQVAVLLSHQHRLEMLEARLDLKLAEVLEKMKWSDPEASERVDIDLGRE